VSVGLRSRVARRAPGWDGSAQHGPSAGAGAGGWSPGAPGLARVRTGVPGCGPWAFRDPPQGDAAADGARAKGHASARVLAWAWAQVWIRAGAPALAWAWVQVWIRAGVRALASAWAQVWIQAGALALAWAWARAWHWGGLPVWVPAWGRAGPRAWAPGVPPQASSPSPFPSPCHPPPGPRPGPSGGQRPPGYPGGGHRIRGSAGSAWGLRGGFRYPSAGGVDAPKGLPGFSPDLPRRHWPPGRIEPTFPGHRP